MAIIANQSVDVSIIIPVYNRRSLLESTLQSICRLALPAGAQIETILCDDGSSEDILTLVKSFEARLTIRYCYQPDQGFRAAAARNMGIQLAKGKFILFLDSGTLVISDLLKEHLLTHALTASPAVVFGPMHGHSAESEEAWSQLAFDQEAQWSSLLENNAILDPRVKVWESCDFRLERLSAPWVLCWGSNISVPRQALLEINGFDEAFVGWGSEDTDLAYRLYEHGLSFQVNQAAITLHLPHETSSRSKETNYLNRRMIYRRSPNLRTELLLSCNTLIYNELWDEIQAVVGLSLMPDYLDLGNQQMSAWLKKTFERPGFLFGGGRGELAAILECTWMCDLDPSKTTYAKHQYPWLTTSCSIGLLTEIQSQFAGTAVLSDYWRAFPRRLIRTLIKEARRIGRRVFLLYTPSCEVPRMASAPDWDINLLIAALHEDNLRLIKVFDEEPTLVYEISGA